MSRAARLVVSLTLLATTGLAALATPGPSSAVAATRPDVLFGAYVDGMMARPYRLTRFESLVRAHADVASYYYGYGDIFPGPLEHRFADGGGRRVLISWHLDVDRYAAWAEGRHDGYLAQVAAAARRYPYRLYVRPWAEMNGDWQPFQPTPDGSRPAGGTYEDFKAAWRHVVTYMRRHGATNIRWVFNPSADVYPETTPVEEIWPGAAYVDVLGIDGFNWGQDARWGRWLAFPRIFAPMYRRVTALHPTAPVWICEFASKEPRIDDGAPVDPAHSKGDWLRYAVSYRHFPRVRALVYFHARKERDWRVDSSAEALRALRQVLAD